MLYLIEDLDKAYHELKDIFKEDKLNEKLRIYAIPQGYEKINVDVEKTVEDLKYMHLLYNEFLLVEFKKESIKELKSLVELSLEDWRKIFYNFNAENEYSIYSKKLEEKDYEQIITQIREAYLKYNNKFYSKWSLTKQKEYKQLILEKKECTYFSQAIKEFFDEYILRCWLKKICFIEKLETLKELGFDEENLDRSINDFLEKVSLGLETGLDKEKILCFVKKSIPKLLKAKEKPFGGNFVVTDYDSDLNKKNIFFTFSILKKEYILSFISLFYFNIKPVENITLQDVDELLKNLCPIEKDDLENWVKELYQDCNRELQKEKYENDFVEYFFNMKEEEIKREEEYSIQRLLKNIFFKFNLLIICAIEKIYKYLNLNNFLEQECNEIKEKLKGTCLRDLYSEQLFSVDGQDFKNEIWSSYLKYLEKLNFKVEKNFYYNDFFRMELFSRKEIFLILSEIQNEIEKEFKNKNEAYKKLLKNSKGNFKKLKFSEREIGQENYRRIVSYYDKKISSLSEEILKETIRKRKEDFILTYMFLQREKNIFNIKNFLDEVKDKDSFITYNYYIDLIDIYEFKIGINIYRNNISILDQTVLNFSYRDKKLEEDELRPGEYYVVKFNNDSKDIFLLKYLGRLNNEFLFRNDYEIKSYHLEEIDVRKIKSLEFYESQEEKQISLF